MILNNISVFNLIFDLEKFYQQILDAVETPVYWMNSNGVVVGSNKAMNDIFGFDIKGKCCSDVLTPQNATYVSEKIHDVLKNKVAYYFTLKDFQNKHYHVYKKAIYSSDSVVGVVGVVKVGGIIRAIC